MDENLRETTELPESGGTAPNEENEPETKSIRFVPSAYDPRGIEQWLSERAAEGKLLLRYDDFVIGEPRDCRYHLEPAADDDDPDELLREKRARLGWEYVCRTKDGIFYIWRGEKTAHVPTSKDCTDSYGYRRLCKKLRRSYFLPLMQQDLVMHLQYRPRVPYEKMHTKVHVLYGNQDPMFQDASLIAQWGAFSEGVDATEFSGGHFYLNQCQKPVGQLVTEHLLQELAGLSI